MALLDGMLDSILHNNFTGWYGEALTEWELDIVKLLGRKGKVLRNIYLPKDNGETSELDIIYITQKGILVFESKNYSGWIFGDEKSQYWTAMLPNREKNRFYNPIKQNRTHLKWLSNYIGETIPLFSIIVFSERCELKKVHVENPDIKVIKRDRTFATVRNIWDKHPDILNDETIDNLYDRLSELTHADAVQKTAHIKNIEEKYSQKKREKSFSKSELTADSTNLQRNPEENNLNIAALQNKSAFQKESEKFCSENTLSNDLCKVTATSSDANHIESDFPADQTNDSQISISAEQICPRCGSKLVLRTARKGTNTGNQFWGCSAFPKCRYIRNVEKHENL